MPILQYVISCQDMIDPSTEYTKVKRSFLSCSIHAERWRNGRGEIEDIPKGKIYWVDAKVSPAIDSAMQKDIDVKFRKYYTVSKANYIVEDMYLRNGQYPLSDFFNVKKVEGNDSIENTKLVFEGDVSRVKRIGQNMNAGDPGKNLLIK